MSRLVPIALAACVAACSVETQGLAPERARDSGPVTDRDAGRTVGRDGGPRDAEPRDADARDADARDAATADAGPYDVIDGECELGSRFGAMVVISDPGAYGGRAVVAPAGTPDWRDEGGGTLPPDRVEIPVDLRGGDYDVWVHLHTADAMHDALYAGFEATDLRRFFHRRWGQWEWVRGHDDMPRALFFRGLAPGPRTLVIGVGEADVQCDRVIVTNDPSFVPPPPP